MTMETDQDVFYKFQLLLSSIVLGTDREVREAWTKLQELEKDVEMSAPSCDCVAVLRDFQRNLLHEQVQNLQEIPRLLRWFAKYLRNVPNPTFSEDLAILLRNSNIDDISILESILHVVSENRVYFATSSNHRKLCKAIVNCLADCQMPFDKEEIVKYTSSVGNIQDYLQPLMDKKHLSVCLEELYSIISDLHRVKPPGYALSIILLLLDKSDIEEGVQLVLSSPYKTPDLVQALIVISKWLLKGKHNELLADWLMAFIEGLEFSESYDILTNLMEAMLTSEIVYLAFILPKQSQTVGKIFLHMLQNQGNPTLFHKFIEAIQMKSFNGKNILNLLEFQKGDYARESLQNIVDVVQGLMLRFPGNQDLYQKMLESFPVKPRKERVLKILNEPFWTKEKEEKLQISCSSERGKMNIVGVDSIRNVDSKVGLANLGNTCYMNSVLQALAMTRQFRHEVLNYKVNDLASQLLLGKLQNLFALLQYSKRNSLSPNEILQVSRPAYFLPGQQQDSSEFLW